MFTEDNILSHKKGAGEAAFLHYKTDERRAVQGECTESLFIEPLRWMNELGILETQGKVRRQCCCEDIICTSL